MRFFLDNLCKNKRILFIIASSIVLGLVLDAFVYVTGRAVFWVGSDYPNEVFSSVCTIAVLGNAMLALLFDSSERIVKGIPFRDVLHFTTFGSEQKLTIFATTMSIVLALFSYDCFLLGTL